MTRSPLHFPRQPLGTGEEGFVLVAALLTLLLLVVIGISATTTSTIEVQIAGNDKAHAVSFYNADGGAEAGTLLVEENFGCPGGFTANQADGSAVIGSGIKIETTSLNLSQNAALTGTPLISDTLRDAVFPATYSSGQAHTNLRFGGVTEYAKGAGLAQAAGYEGKGKGAGAGGAAIYIDIYSQYIGEANSSEADIRLQWRHAMGSEGDCRY